MSHFITCKPNKDGDIQAFFEFQTKISFELCLLELFYSLSWHVSFGMIGLIYEGQKFEQEVICIDYSNFDVLQDITDILAERHGLKTKPKIRYDYSKRQLLFESGDPKVSFYVGSELCEYLGLKNNQFGNLKVSCLSRLEKVKLMNIYCDVIFDQVIGDSKSKLLRQHRVLGEPGRISSMVYTYPHYLPLSRSSFQYINIWITDQNENTINFNKEILVKLHMRQKK